MHQNICEGHPKFIVTADLWPAFLYPFAKAKEEDVQHGLFQSTILVKVKITFFTKLILMEWVQAFKFLFTSPTLAQEISSENDVLNPPPQSTKQSRGHKAPTRGHVANILGI